MNNWEVILMVSKETAFLRKDKKVLHLRKIVAENLQAANSKKEDLQAVCNLILGG